jgi:threonine/homoserine/homoserine lactone efflux protein
MPVEPACVAAEGQRLLVLAGFFAGYAAILATPGPNLLAVAGIAALRGLRGVWPLCLGIALGAGTLNAAVLLFAFGLAADGAGWDRVARAIGALFLLHVAVSVARLRPPVLATTAAAEAAAPVERRRRGGGGLDRATAMGAGFLTAGTNPLTGTFFAGWHVGCVGSEPDRAALGLVVLGVCAIAFGFFLCVAALLARPGPRRAALAWHRPIRLGAAATLLVMSAATFRSALG